MPRAALKDLANARGLASAAAEARSETPYTAEKGYGDEPEGVELWADWPCSSVRLRGEPAVVRRAVSLTAVMDNPKLYRVVSAGPFDHKWSVNEPSKPLRGGAGEGGDSLSVKVE